MFLNDFFKNLKIFFDKKQWPKGAHVICD